MANWMGKSEGQERSDGEERLAFGTPLKETPSGSHLIGSILSPAVRLWLRSQVEHVEELRFHIQGGDRQILSGYVPQVSVSARRAVYQGLHLTQVQLEASEIRVNLGQVMRGKPLRLLHIVPVEGELVLSQADLNASLQAPLLANAVSEFLLTLLRSGVSDVLESGEDRELNLQNLQMAIVPNRLVVGASLISVSGNATPIAIRTGVTIQDGHILQLVQPEWLPHAQAKRGLPLKDLDGFAIDLGTDVDFREFRLEQERIFCQGRINVIPA